jgi:hypothetical protein
MSPCTDCLAARGTDALWNQYNPVCLYCGARLLQFLKGLYKTRPDLRAGLRERKKTVIADWTALDHTKEQLEELAAGPPAFEPLPERRKK